MLEPQTPGEAGYLENLSRNECIALLEMVRVGRVGITSKALPHILPVNFGVFNDAIYFRTSPGTKLDAATANAVVAFQADAYAPDGSAGWSVLVIGPCCQVNEDPSNVPSGSRAFDDLVAWPLGEQARHTVRVEMDTVTGRRFGNLANPWLILH